MILQSFAVSFLVVWVQFFWRKLNSISQLVTIPEYWFNAVVAIYSHNKNKKKKNFRLNIQETNTGIKQNIHNQNLRECSECYVCDIKVLDVAHLLFIGDDIERSKQNVKRNWIFRKILLYFSQFTRCSLHYLHTDIFTLNGRVHIVILKPEINQIFLGGKFLAVSSHIQHTYINIYYGYNIIIHAILNIIHHIAYALSDRFFFG